MKIEKILVIIVLKQKKVRKWKMKIMLGRISISFFFCEKKIGRRVNRRKEKGENK